MHFQPKTISSYVQDQDKVFYAPAPKPKNKSFFSCCGTDSSQLSSGEMNLMARKQKPIVQKKKKYDDFEDLMENRGSWTPETVKKYSP